MDELISGFGYCLSIVGPHKYLGIYKNSDNKYYTKIDDYRSVSMFDNLNDMEGLWSCVGEVRKQIVDDEKLVA